MAPSEEFIFLSVQVDTLPRFLLESRSFSKMSDRAPRRKRMVDSVRAHVQSLFPTISRSWHPAFCFLLRKDKNQASISYLLKGSIGSRYIFTRHQKWQKKTRFWGLSTPFFSKNGANSLLPSPDSTGKNLSKSVIIGQMPKKRFENVG